MTTNIEKTSKDDLYRRIAEVLLQEVINGKDLTTIMNRDKFFEILDSITQNKNQNLYIVHTKLKNDLITDQSFQNDECVDILNKNNQKLFQEIYQKIKKEFKFEIELHKYGKTFNSIRKRWAYILYPDTFGSTKQPLLIKSSNKPPEKIKDKNFSLKNMKSIIIEDFSTTAKDWKADKTVNPVRISIQFEDINKKKRITDIYLYFKSLDSAREILELLLLMRMKFKSNESIIFKTLPVLCKNIESANKFQIMKKFIDVKNKILSKKIVLKSLNKHVNENYNNFQNFSMNICKNFLGNFLETLENKKKIISSGKFIFSPKFDILLSNFFKKEENNFSKFNTFNTLKIAKDTLRRFFLNKLKSKYPHKYLHKLPAAYVVSHNKQISDPNNKKIKFKIKKPILSGNFPKTKKNSIEQINLDNTKELTINTKNNEIIFGNKKNTFLNSEEILDINSVYLNLNERGLYEENSIIINGNKKDSTKFFDFKLKKDFLNENNITTQEEYIEPEFHSLKIDQSPYGQFYPKIIQIFHTNINLPLNYLKYLEKINLNIENQNADLKLSNPIQDFFFYISFNINNKFYARTKLTKGSLYENENLVIEFNNQLILNEEIFQNFKNFQMKISVNLIPAASLEYQGTSISNNKIVQNFPQENILYRENDINKSIQDFKLENYIENLRPHEIAYCILDVEKIKSRKNEFILYNNFSDMENESINNNNNYIILNIFSDAQEMEKNKLTKLISKDFSIGQEIYYLNEYSKDDFDRILNNPNIPMDIKEKFYNVEFDNENNFLLRPNIENHQEFLKDFCTDLSEEKILKILKNSKYKYLPICEKLIDMENLSKSNNMYLNKKFIKQENLTDNNYIYRLKKISKYSLCKIIGISYSNNILLKDLFIGKYFSVRILDLLTRKGRNTKELLNDADITENILFKHIQENLFSIYDFEDIEINQTTYLFNHNWKLCLKFFNKTETTAFLYYLKELRRNANSLDYPRSIVDKKIDEKKLIFSIKNFKEEFKNLNILIEKIEFKKLFALTGKRKLQINLLRGSEINNQNRNLLEILNDNQNTQFSNSIMLSRGIKNEYDILLNSKTTKISMPSALEFDREKLNSLKNQIFFDVNLDYNYKLFELNVIPIKDNIFTLEILFSHNDNSPLSMQDLFNFTCEADLKDVINGNLTAEFKRFPLISREDKKIIGMVDLKYWISDSSVSTLAKENQFNTLIDKRFSSFIILKQDFKDCYGNIIPIEKINPNLFKRKILKILEKEIKTDVITAKARILTETNGEVKNKLNINFKNKGVFGHRFLSMGDLNNINTWAEMVPDQEYLKIRALKKCYIKDKKRFFYEVYSNQHWENYFKKKIVQNSAYEIPVETTLQDTEQNIKEILGNENYLIKMKKENKQTYLDIKNNFFLGVPKNLRLLVWETLLKTDNLCELTIKNLQDRENSINFNQLTGKKEVYEYFLSHVKNKSKFNINFAAIDNDMNYLDRTDNSSDGNNHNFGGSSDFVNKKNLVLVNIKNICKAYFLWTDLNIISGFKDEQNKKKYIYFFGILKIIKTLLSVFEEENHVFWILIGLSQVIELFYQTNPLFSNQLNYEKIYIKISKLIIQTSFPIIIYKLQELNFPIEFFLSKMIMNLFSCSFETNFFLRLMDIIIFEASVKTGENENKMDYLRFICLIPLILLQSNEKQIVECKTIRDIELIFENLFKKTYHIEQFFEKLKNNMIKIYKITNFLELFMDVNKNTSWDLKSREISKALNSHFSPIEEENKKYLLEFKKLKFNFDENFIQNYEDFLNTEFSELKKLYSKKNLQTQGNQNLSTGKFTVSICLTYFKYYTGKYENIFFPENSNEIKNTNNLFYAYLIFSEESDYTKINPINSDIKYEIKGSLVENNFQYEILHQDFKDNFPSYLYIYIYEKNKGIHIGSYRYQIFDKDLFKTKSVYCENLNKESYSILEIKFFKFFSGLIEKNETDLNAILFKSPKYLYNYKIDNLVDNTQYGENDTKSLKISSKKNNEIFLSEINEAFPDGSENSFIRDQLISNYTVYDIHEKSEIQKILLKKKTDSENIFKKFIGNLINIKNNSETLDFYPDFLSKKLDKICDIIVDNYSKNPNEYFKSYQNYVESNNKNLTFKDSNKNEIKEYPNLFTHRIITRIINKNFSENSSEIKNLLYSFLNTENSFEEILYSLILIDNFCITLYEKLYLLYQIGKMQNYALCRKDSLTLKKFKEMIYILYKRYMVNFNKSEIDNMIDYLIKKEEFACVRFAVCYNSDNISKITNILNENEYRQRETFSDIFNLKINNDERNQKFYLDIKSDFNNYINLIKNNFLVEKINENYLNSIWDLIRKNNMKKLKNKFEKKLLNFDTIAVDFSSDNLRKVNNISIGKENKDLHNLENVKNKNKIIKSQEIGEKRFIEDLIFEDINSVNLNNIDSDENIYVSYDLFKDVFFNLPFISEFLRASSGFTEESNDNLNRPLNFVKVHLNIGNNSKLFTFYDEIFKGEALKNLKNQNIISYINMGENLLTTNSFQEIFDKIILKLKDLREFQREDVINYFLLNPNMIIISTYLENENNIRERMKFFDPLYSSNLIRKLLTNNAVHIEFNLDVNEDYSRFDISYNEKEAGYLKLRYSKDCYEWKECKIKTLPNNQGLSAKLCSSSIVRKYEFKVGAFDCFKK